MSKISSYTRKFFLGEVERILESGDVEKDIRPILIFEAQAPTKLTECLHWSGNKWTATFEEQEAFRMARSRDEKERAAIADERKALAVKDIIARHLHENGYDGLYNADGECDCELSNLAPCDDPSMECRAGYKGPCGDGHYWRIGAEKP